MPHQNIRSKKTTGAFRSIAALCLREMSTRYGRTPGGYIWSIVEPLATILLLSIGFSLVVRTPSLGTSFFLFYATGFLPLYLFQNVSNTTARALKFSKPLLRYPAVTWIDALLARFLTNALTGLLVSAIIIAVALIISDDQGALDMSPVITALILSAAIGFAVGALNAVIFGLFPIWEVAWAIVSRPLMLASGVFYIFDDLPTAAQEILWYNPMLHVTGIMREGFYTTYSASYASVTFISLVAMTICALGLTFMRKYNGRIIQQ